MRFNPLPIVALLSIASAHDQCELDDLFFKLIDPRYKPTASSFCSTFIRPTISTASTTTASSTTTDTVYQTRYSTTSELSTKTLVSYETVSSTITSIITSYFTVTISATTSDYVATVNIGTTDFISSTDVITSTITVFPTTSTSTPAPVTYSTIYPPRDIKPNSIPECFQGWESKALSTACSCFLSTPVPATTVYTRTTTVLHIETCSISKTTTLPSVVSGISTVYITSVNTVYGTKTLTSDVTRATTTQTQTVDLTKTIDVDTSSTLITTVIDDITVTISPISSSSVTSSSSSSISTSSTSTSSTSSASSTSTSTSSTTSTSASSTVPICTVAPTVYNGNFETGSLPPWTYTQTSDSGVTDSSISVTSPIASDGNEGSYVANIVLGTDQDNSLTITNTVYGLCEAGNEFRVNFDYYCQTQDFDTEIAAYIDGNELYASSCNFPGSWQTDNLLYSTSTGSTAEVTIVISWQTAGNQGFTGTAFTWQVDNVYGITGFE